MNDLGDVPCGGNMVVNGYIAVCDVCGHVVGKSDLDDFGDSPHRELQKWDCKRDGCVYTSSVCGKCGKVYPSYPPKPPIDFSDMGPRKRSRK